MQELNYPVINDNDARPKLIVSRVAYLIGVPKKNFEHTFEMEEYEKLEKDKAARIIRNLCRLRTTIESSYGFLYKKIKAEYRTIATIEETEGMVNALINDGVNISRSYTQSLRAHVVEINKEISNRINNCKHIIPDWVVWEYVRNLFIMPGGNTEEGVRSHITEYYYKYKSLYPYSVYINWEPEDCGNILFNDEKFLMNLYRWNHDEFKDPSKVKRLDETTRANIDDFIDNSKKLDIIVDCENSDPYRLAVTLNSLEEYVTDKVHRLILIDDPNTVNTWKFFDRYVKSYEIEHIMMDRVMERKSLVDIGLSVKIFREFFEAKIDSFLLCSSDSDYYAVIKGLPEAKFLVLAEKDALGKDMKEALANENINYAYIERFYSGEDGQDIKTRVILSEITDTLARAINLNAKQLLSDALCSTRIKLSDAEFDQFYRSHIRPMTLQINEDENIVINIKN